MDAFSRSLVAIRDAKINTDSGRLFWIVLELHPASGYDLMGDADYKLDIKR
jgi:hypothetical protein